MFIIINFKFIHIDFEVIHYVVFINLNQFYILQFLFLIV